MKIKLLILSLLISVNFAFSKTITTEVLVVAGSASGTPAAIQAARSGAKVVLVESTSWLGGMVTAAGVTCVDGNHLMPSGLWGEFREKLYNHYGGPNGVRTGWVSYTLFEPKIGNKFWNELLNSEKNITVIYNYHIVDALVENGKVVGAIFANENESKHFTVRAEISIDATELGDLMAFSGCNYFVGQDSKYQTGEIGAPDIATDVIQDLTYVAVLKDYGKGSDNTIGKPDNYSSKNYYGTCAELSLTSKKAIHSCNYMFDYGRLPNNKFMINWPIYGNDYYLNVIEKPYLERKKLYKKAKDFTLGWIYFMQTVGGYKHLGLAKDEFPTDDHLALIPYHRESRRLDGLVQLCNTDVVDMYSSLNGYFKDGIAVGDYPLDLHHNKSPKDIFFKIQPIHSFSIPYGCLVPKEIDGLIVAEKSISVSHIVNGCTRLQPVVMGIGQAAGAAAALCIKNKLQPRNVNIRNIQQILLNSKCWISPIIDVDINSPYFKPIQKMVVSAVMQIEGISKDWQNLSYFYPEQFVSDKELKNCLNIVMGKNERFISIHKLKRASSFITKEYAAIKIWEAKGSPFVDLNLKFKDVNPKSKLYKALCFLKSKNAIIDIKSIFNPKQNLKRRDLAFLLNYVFDPFNRLEK